MCPKDVPCSRHNLDIYNLEQKAKPKQGKNFSSSAKAVEASPFSSPLIYLSHGIVPIIKMWDVAYLQELHPLTNHSSKSWNHEWKIQQVIKYGGRS